jgi:hypothetical protein
MNKETGYKLVQIIKYIGDFNAIVTVKSMYNSCSGGHY